MDFAEKGARPVYVVGHKNPDTDSISSAIAYAYLKNTTGTGQYGGALIAWNTVQNTASPLLLMKNHFIMLL